MHTKSSGSRNPLAYILITAARNEESLIERTIRSVISQTVLPKRWYIVNDGSMDRTREIVSRFVADHDWMELLEMPPHEDHSFAAKVHCFNAAHRRLGSSPFDVIGNLDADISFGPDYFEFLLGKFEENPRLGVAGTPFVEGGAHYDFRYATLEHVSGACQLFRKECFEEVGGYIPVKEGGIDWIAVTTARMKGWTTRTFLERTCYHHRKIGTGGDRPAIAVFKYGRKNYMLGGHPLWQLLRAFFQMKKRPYVIGGLLLISGYAWGFMTRTKRPLSRDLLSFYRREQMSRLKRILIRYIGGNREEVQI